MAAKKVKPGVIVFEGQSLTKQSFKDETDINRIVARVLKTGVVPGTAKQGVFADVSSLGDYRASLHMVRDAEVAFAALPSKVRDRFDNDPVKLVTFLQDPQNRPQAVELGLIEGKAPQSPEKRAVGDPSASGGTSSAGSASEKPS